MKFNNESVLREILEHSLAGYWDWDIPTGNEYLSPSFKRMFGYEDHEIENRADSWQKLIFEEDLPGVLEKYNQHVGSKGQIPFYKEIRFHHKNGSTVWIICTGKVIEWDESGNARRMVGCHIDITERKRMEKALQESEEKYRLLFNSGGDSIFIHDQESRILEVNRQACKQFGYTREELLSMTVDQIDSPEEIQHIAERISRLIQHGHTRFESVHRRKDGSLILHEVSTTKIVWDGREAIMSICRDITDRKRIEEKLLEERDWFEYILRITKTGFDVIDDEFNILFIDKVWQQGYGDPTGRKCYEYFNGFSRPCPNCGIPKALETKKVVVVEEVLAREGNRIVEVHTMPFQHKSGRWMVVEFNLDITNRKRTEEVLANAQKIEALGVLAGGIAHDFNNLMAGIFGYIELASGASTEVNVKEYLANVMQTIGRARALTQQLLTFAKGGSPKQEISPLFPFVEQTAHFALSGSNVACRFDIASDLWYANYDKNQIGQVIDNLVINAQQAMPLGGTIVLSACNVSLADNEHPILKRGDYVRLSVTDTGIGVPRELQQRIFDPFFTTKAKGHGLGLATSYSIIKRHGGCIDVYSELGKGTTFNVYLPATRETALSSSYASIEEHKGTGMFLVMDDEDVVREIISTILETFGYKVVSTVNGQDAIDQVVTALRENRTFAGMLFDLTVPGALGGKEAIDQIRKMGVHTPAFVASGYADDPIMRNPAKYGFTASIRKPFLRIELIEMLEKHMKKKE